MSKYTLQLRNALENGVDIFDFDYPIFDPAYKTVLETKIKEYYYFREIGLETLGQFKWFLKSKMNRIMPYYNEMYKQNEVFKTYDPYKNKNVTTTETRTASSTSTGNSQGKETFSDTPQAKIDGQDYATNLTVSDGTSTGEVTSTDEYTQTIAGHDGMRYPSDILKDLRETLINIDQMIIDELHDLFMNIY